MTKKFLKKLKQNIKKTLRISSPSEESLIDMDCFNKNIEEAIADTMGKEGQHGVNKNSM